MRSVIDLLFVMLPGTLLLDLAGPAEAFRLANRHAQQRGLAPAFRLRFIGPEPEADSSVGALLSGLAPLPGVLDAPSWVVLMGLPGGGAEAAERAAHPSPAWLATRQWLGEVVAPHLAATLPGPGDRAGAGLVTVCSGGLLAADAGLLAGRRCTTHHELLEALSQLAPAAQVCHNRVFVVDGAVASSAGITAGIDLALHLVARTCGNALAAGVARDMVVYLRRGPDDPELSPLLAWRNHLHPAVHRVQDAVCERPGRAWSAHALAQVAHVTPRHLGRLFREQAGISPREYVERIRTALAQQALQQGATVQKASDLAGFSSTRQWRRARSRRTPGSPLSSS
ncbi:GlxA family transcriptional regulator [Ideonella sp. BN130291]|uniref:GlxA family transcriptional regulator n=1 Tax=Ideonella sp. BN130291 TaxID=3112940 RepID=UPI002E275380|nr:helix-turn-helix domain-containing protein [Ideonella sp. BN130291]